MKKFMALKYEYSSYNADRFLIYYGEGIYKYLVNDGYGIAIITKKYVVHQCIYLQGHFEIIEERNLDKVCVINAEELIRPVIEARLEEEEKESGYTITNKEERVQHFIKRWKEVD